MNGPFNTATDRYLAREDSSGIGRSVLTGVETAHVVVGAGTTRQVSNGNGAFANLREGIAGLGIGKGIGSSGSKSPAKLEMEVEMQ